MNAFFVVALAILLDKLFSEPKRFHPLVGFGHWAIYLERKLNPTRNGATKHLGLLAYLLALTPCIALVMLIIPLVLVPLFETFFTPKTLDVIFQLIIPAVILYLAIGWQSLMQHAEAISNPLARGELDKARYAVSMVVSRDTDQLDEAGIAKAATESVLENGADAIFAAIFWFIVAGIPGVIIYRLSNTLDAMWGYKNQRFLHFGWAAARIDDVLNYLPARLTALTYALVGNTRQALACWKQQAPDWKSPNAGPVMSAGAGALNISLGGAAIYHNHQENRPLLGPALDNGQKLGEEGHPPSAQGIVQSCQLVTRSLFVWLFILMIASSFMMASRL